jgi:hypothetical protein
MKTTRLILLLLATPLLSIARTVAAEAPTPAPAAADPWDAIKELTYQKRADFAAGAAKLLEKIDGEIRQLNEKRATLPETSVKDWDFAMKELNAAQAYLKFTITSLDEASSETWAEAKNKVAQAWKRANDACDKVKASTTT